MHGVAPRNSRVWTGPSGAAQHSAGHRIKSREKRAVAGSEGKQWKRLASSAWSTLDSLPLAATTSSFLAVQFPQRPSYRTYTPHRNLRLSSTSSSSSLLLNYSPSSSSSSASVRSPSPPSLHNRVLCCRFPPKLPLLLLLLLSPFDCFCALATVVNPGGSWLRPIRSFSRTPPPPPLLPPLLPRLL